jgi:polysaccharide deacetylase family protein (PEP-CTERM system associated)
LLEDLCGARIRGYRASTYSITKRSLWALDVLCSLGFEYDSSIFPIRHDVYGIPDAEEGPGFVTTPDGARLAEFPMSTARILGFKLPVSGGGYFRLLPYWLTRSGLASINANAKRPFVFYLHPWEVDPGQPRVNASALSRFRHYTNIDKTEERLGSLIREFRFDSMERVLGGMQLIH